MSDIEDRLDRLESLVKQQQETIEDQQETIAEQSTTIDDQRERIADLEAEPDDKEPDDEEADETEPPSVNRRTALKTGGLLAAFGLGTGATAGTASADPSGRIGTSSDPLEKLYTAELYGDSGTVTVQDDLDLTGSNIADSGSTIWDGSNGYVPQSRLQNDSLTVAGNSVSLGSSTGIAHSDLSNIGAGDHHTRPSAGAGLTESSNTFDINPADFAGAGLSEDGSNNLQVDEGSLSHDNLTNISADDHHAKDHDHSEAGIATVGSAGLATPFADLSVLFGSPVTAGGAIQSSSGNALTFNTDGGSRTLELGPPKSVGGRTAGGNVVAGHPNNAVNNDAGGVVISGGGNDLTPNSVGNNYATVGGGQENDASGFSTTVGGGSSNTASGIYATVPGGHHNTASGGASFAAGKYAAAEDGRTFVWNDGSGASTDSGDSSDKFSSSTTTNLSGAPSGADTFSVKAASGVRFVTSGDNTSHAYVDTSGNVVASGALDANGGTVQNSAGALTLSTGSGNLTLNPSGRIDLNGNNLSSTSGSEFLLDVDSDATNGDEQFTVQLNDIRNTSSTIEWRRMAAAGVAFRVHDRTNGNALLSVNDSGEVDIENGNLDLNGNNANNVASIDNGGSAIGVDDSLDLSGNALTDTAGTLTVESSSGNSLTFNTDGGSRALELGPPGSNGSYTTGGNFVAGYTGNSVNNSAVGVVIGGGGQSRPDRSNTAGANFATVGGGQGNTANGPSATVAGGNSNEATDTNAFVGGGFGNVAGNNDATVPGGSNNKADGIVSFAAGREAKANDTGSFVWADSSYDSFKSGDAGTNGSPTGGDTFHVLSTGGVRFVTGRNASNQPNAGAYLSSGGSSWQAVSARSTKHDIEPVDPQSVLAALDDIEVHTWAYDSNPDAQHMGPMAGEFHEAFELGDDPQTIGHVDADGVAFAAIQGLAERLDDARAALDEKDERLDDLEAALDEKDERIEDQQDRIEKLETENDRLHERNEELEDRLERIEAELGIDARASQQGVADD